MAGKPTFEVRGIPELTRELKKWIKRYPDATPASLYQEGLGVMQVSQPRVPVDTGRLRATGYVAPPDPQATVPTVEVGYGTDYAIYVHERTELHHQVGEAKFLEKAVNERSGGFVERLGRRIRQNAEAGVVLGQVQTDIPTRPKEA